MKGELFDRRFLAIAIPVAAVSLVGTLIALVLGPELFDTPGVGPGRTGRSAIGHRAFFDLLASLEIEVETSRADSWHKAGDGSLLIFAEPEAPSEDADGQERSSGVDFTEQIPYERVLIVLPKRRAHPHPENPAFAGHVSILPVEVPLRVLRALDPFLAEEEPWEVVRPERSAISWEGSELSGTPDLDEPQLIRHPRLETWLGGSGGARGTLIGRIRGEETEFIIVSDPDLIANHGLARGRGANAQLAVELIEKLLEGPRRVIVDETCHGAGLEGGFWREALRFPLALVLIHGALVAAVVLWSSFGRFGTPEPEAVGYEAGSLRLVRSTADLLRSGGHGSEALRRYLRIAADEACRRLHGPTSGTLATRLAWLGERGRMRESSLDIGELAARAATLPARADEAKVRELALAIDRWRQEIVHGSAEDRGGR